MQFRKVTSTKYISDHGYSLIQCKDNSFCIHKDSKLVEWGSDFVSVKAAENFMNSHNYIKATSSTLPISDSDVDFIIDYFGFDPIGQNRYQKDDIILDVEEDNGEQYACVDYRGKHFCSRSIEDFIRKLDRFIPENAIFASVIYRGTEYRQIFAAKDSRSPRDITKDLIRVKSSNVWAYGIEIKDRKAAKGDVYVQFKGKNGGPSDLYRYYDVSVQTWRKFLSAPSKGAFIWKYLRNSVPYSKLTGNKRGVLPNAVN